MAAHKIEFRFSAEPWQYTGAGGWIFASLPKELSDEIRQHFKGEEEGWGRMTVMAKLGSTEWKTAIWFDTKADTYLLPLKADVRKKEKVALGKKIEVALFI